MRRSPGHLFCLTEIPGMATYILRRILISLPIILGITVIVFLLASQMPGDAVMAMISSDTPLEADLIKLRQGQLGYSFQTGEPVFAMIMRRIPATLQLMGISLIISIFLGVILGTISALRQYSLLDYGLTLFGFAGISIPDFFLGMILVFVFALKLDWFPTSGMVTAGTDFSWADNLHHVFLPALALALVRTSVFMRYTRASVLEVINDDYVRTARAKGMTEWVVTTRHILRNALIPVITVIGINLTVLFAGSVIIETIFQWPGIGMMFINAISLRDSPVIMGYVLFSAFVVLVANLLTDVTYSWADPRIRYE
jgi:peptide/nickel transport system permease protein